MAADELPVIFSPLSNVPVTLVRVNSGATASVSLASDSYTATNLKASALPSDITLSDCLVPNA